MRVSCVSTNTGQFPEHPPVPQLQASQLIFTKSLSKKLSNTQHASMHTIRFLVFIKVSFFWMSTKDRVLFCYLVHEVICFLVLLAPLLDIMCSLAACKLALKRENCQRETPAQMLVTSLALYMYVDPKEVHMTLLPLSWTEISLSMLL